MSSRRMKKLLERFAVNIAAWMQGMKFKSQTIQAVEMWFWETLLEVPQSKRNLKKGNNREKDTSRGIIKKIKI